MAIIEQERYNIRPNEPGGPSDSRWVGDCPTCGETFEAISPTRVILRIAQHQEIEGRSKREQRI